MFSPKPSLKIRTASAIFWIYLGILYLETTGYFLGLKLLVFQDRKQTLSTCLKLKLIQTIVVFNQLSDWVEILWGFTQLIFKQMLKVSFFYLEKQKSWIPKKIFLKPLSISKQKKLCLLTRFSKKVLVFPFALFEIKIC